MRRLVKILFIITAISTSLNTYATGINDLIISEICILNNSIIQDETGNFSDWVEIYNNGSADVNLQGLYLSDDPTTPLKFQIKASDIVIAPGKYFLLWADNSAILGSKHLGFKLSVGESFILYDSIASQIIDSINLTNDTPDYSTGRDVMNKTAPWLIYTQPTPETVNSTSGFHDVLSAPIYSVAGGFFSTATSVTLSAENNQKIYYTLDAHDPNPDSTYTTLYSGETISINTSTVVRAQCIQDGFLPSTIETNTYFINQKSVLPTLSLVSDPENLFGKTTGIYTHPWNEGDAWERFEQLQYFLNDTLTYSCNSGIRIQGGNSVGMAKKSFRLHFRGDYGNGRFKYPIFDNANTVTSFNTLVLRSGYDDSFLDGNGTLLRDPYSTTMWRKTGNLASSSKFVTLTLNNAYWGIYDLRESVDEDFITDYLGTTNFDMMRYQKTGAELKYGTRDEWTKLENFFKTTDFTVDSAFYAASEIIDMDNFIDVLSFVHCTNFRSWTWGCSAYKRNDIDDKWRWVMWDTDRAYYTSNWDTFSEYSILLNEKWANFMPKELIKNRLFKEALLNRVCDYTNAYFRPDNAVMVIDSLAAIIAPEVEANKARWKSDFDWEKNVNKLRIFMQDRPENLRSIMKSHFAINNTYDITINTVGSGKVILNSLTLDTFPWTGTYLENIPVKLTAVADKGYMFKGWSNNKTSETLDNYILLGDSSITAIFIKDTTNYKISINEIMYNPDNSRPSGEWIELYNEGDALDLSGWWINDNDDTHNFVFPEGTIIEANNYLVIAEDLILFRAVNTSRAINAIGEFGFGDNPFGLSNKGETIKLYKADGVLMDSVKYNDKTPWPILADGFGPSLQVVKSNISNDEPSNWNASLSVPFTPGAPNKFTVTSVNEIYTINKLDIYPNPTKNNLTVVLSGTGNELISAEIIALTGKIVDIKSVSATLPKTVISWNVESLPTGIYFIKITTEDQIISEKFIKQ